MRIEEASTVVVQFLVGKSLLFAGSPVSVRDLTVSMVDLETESLPMIDVFPVAHQSERVGRNEWLRIYTIRVSPRYKPGRILPADRLVLEKSFITLMEDTHRAMETFLTTDIGTIEIPEHEIFNREYYGETGQFLGMIDVRVGIVE
jgi:hypothetical protein